MVAGFTGWQETADGLTPPVVARIRAGDVRVIASPDRYELVTNLAGATEDDLSIGVVDNVLSITAATASESCRDVGGFLLVDKRRGWLEQSFVLPLDADEQNIASHFEGGVLSVIIGRRVIAKAIDLRSWHTPYAVC